MFCFFLKKYLKLAYLCTYVHILYILFFSYLHKLLKVDSLFLLLYFPSEGKLYIYIIFSYYMWPGTFPDCEELYFLSDGMQIPTLWGK